MLEIKNLSVSFDDKELLSNINLSISSGERHLITGHNGSGKSTLAQTIMGNPTFQITSGQIIFNGRDITSENTTTRALLGIFLGAQHVPEIPGLSIISFLKHSCIAHTHFQTGKDLSMGDFLQKLESVREKLNIPRDWLNRSINLGFSGGERKKITLMQLLLIQPQLAILDEPDSGADAATKEMIAQTINDMTDTTFIFISHQSDFIKRISPTNTTTLSDGKIMIE